MLSVISMRLQKNINTELSKVRVVVAVLEGGERGFKLLNCEEMTEEKQVSGEKEGVREGNKINREADKDR